MHRRAFITATAAAATVATLKGATAATVPPLGTTGVPVRPGEALPLGPLSGSRYPDPHVESLVKPKGAFGASGFPAFAGTMAVERVATGFRWAEGPVYFPAGRYVLFSDIPNNRIMRYSEDDGHVSVFRQPSMNSNGNTIDREGRLITCEHGGRRVTRTELDGSITIIADKYNGKRLNSPNDAAVAADGSIWFTDPVYGIGGNYEGVKSAPEQDKHNVYRVDPKSGDIKVVVDDFVEPNGIAFAPDEKKLYVIDTGYTDGPNNPRTSACLTWTSKAAKCPTARCLPKCPSPASPTAYAPTPPAMSGARSVGATPTKTAFAATMPAATCSAKSTSRRRSPISASAAPSETDCISAARARSTRSIPARPAP
jgi:gluconolactonase